MNVSKRKINLLKLAILGLLLGIWWITTFTSGANQTMATDSDGSIDSPAIQQGDAQKEVAAVPEESIAANEADIADVNDVTGDVDEITEDVSGQNLQENAGQSEDLPADTSTGNADSAAEILARFLPNLATASQDELQTALNLAITNFPLLYAELISVAIDMGLEPPRVALAAIQALGGANISEDVASDIFLVTTAGISDTSQVEAALLSADIIATPLTAELTQTDRIGVNPRPTNPATTPPSSASPAR